MGVQRIYRNASESPIASYNYTDLAEGTGVVGLYGSNSSNASSSFALMSEAVYPATNYVEAVATTGSFVKVIDVDFDTTFNLPKRVKGNVFVTFLWGYGYPSLNNSGETYFILRVRKYDGTTETEIAEYTSETVVFGNNTRSYQVRSVKIPVSTIQNFKKGDTFRLTVEVWGKKTNSVQTNHYLFFDPKDRTTTTYVPAPASGVQPATSQMRVFVPFVLDI